MKKPEFTKDQEYYICWIIGDWYLSWKHKIANYENKTHSLGYAKEQLKDMLFPDEEWVNTINKKEINNES
jgi:hypothetical protein